MPRHRLGARVNWLAGWGGLVLSFCVALAYVLSADRAWVYGDNSRRLSWLAAVDHGQLHATVVHLPAGRRIAGPPGMSFGRRRWADALAFEWKYEPGPDFRVSMIAPLWPAAALGFLTCAAGCVPRRPSASPFCNSCGYDLNGAPSPTCPECGA
jgi:hypothetical protein